MHIKQKHNYNIITGSNPLNHIFLLFQVISIQRRKENKTISGKTVHAPTNARNKQSK